MPPPVTLPKVVAVMCGAALGGAMRFLFATYVTERIVSRFPWGTFLVNITGCFLIGLLATLLTQRGASAPWSLFLVTGILGGYTTFSSFAWETVQLIRQDAPFLALANAFGSLFCGYAAVWLGVLIARR